MADLMKYIPAYYKKDVGKIYRGEKFWNEYTKKWNTTVVVEWKDGEINEYSNARFMYEKLKDFGRE